MANIISALDTSLHIFKIYFRFNMIFPWILGDKICEKWVQGQKWIV